MGRWSHLRRSNSAKHCPLVSINIHQRIKSILDSARAEHTQAVRSRIDQVSEMKDVVDITKALFELSKETAKLEAESFQLRQKAALASELKSVLDSWVRYEQSQKESEQAELAKSVIDKVLKSLSDEKTQKDILANAVAEVERGFLNFPLFMHLLT